MVWGYQYFRLAERRRIPGQPDPKKNSEKEAEKAQQHINSIWQKMTFCRVHEMQQEKQGGGRFRAKKTCASAQVGAREKYENRTKEFSPINTSGILIVAFAPDSRQRENAKE
ncbi:hypothetical protein [Scandinavium sp.]|uniref:hypothetical protein n=1 Tax=Scandinavium sp. TaxID=2830653 RepID=UPI0028978518|nr:hypothetical protein [Scandinavium sp.]